MLSRCVDCGVPLVRDEHTRCGQCEVQCYARWAIVTLATAAVTALLTFGACSTRVHANAPPVPIAELDPPARLVLAQMVQLEGESDHDGAAVLWTLAHRRDRLWRTERWPVAQVAFEYSRVLRGVVDEYSPRQRRILRQDHAPPDVARLVELWAEGLVSDPCHRPTLHWGAPGRRAPRDAHGAPMVRVDCGPTDNFFFAEAP